MLESTTYPGTTEEVLEPILAGGGLEAGRGLPLPSARSGSIPGAKIWTTKTTPKVVGGVTDRRARKVAQCALRQRDRDHRPGLVPGAELVKLLENIFRWSTSRWSTSSRAVRPHGSRRLGGHRGSGDEALWLHALRARAPGSAGTAFPLDPFYLSWKAREYDFYTEFIELAGKVNTNMPYFCLDKIARALNAAGA